MKRISTDQIVSPTSRQPFTGRSLTFLQDAQDDDKAAIIEALIITNLGSYSLTVPYVISGCVVSDAGKDVTAGEIFYGGKFFEVVAVNGVTNVAQFVLTKTQDATADPLEFTDATLKNVHDIYKYVGTDTATPGDFDSSELTSMYASSKIRTEIFDATSNNITGGSLQSLTGMTYSTPNDGITRTWQIIYTGLSSTAGGNDQIDIFINNDTDTDELANGYCGCNGDNIVYNMQTLVYVGTIPPNKTIKIQADASSGAVALSRNKMSIVEL